MYTLVLTHDIDYLSLKEIPWSCRTLWGFSYRCLRSAFSFRGRSFTLHERAVLLWNCVSMPLIKLGLRSDPWAESLDHMIAMEERLGVRSTLYYLPFANHPGTTPSGTQAPYNRSAFYNVCTHAVRLTALQSRGWEIGVHGIDAYRDVEVARTELAVLKNILRGDEIGIRMHWLYHRDDATWDILERAGYRYDATLGWNEKIGFPGEHYVPFHPMDGRSFQVLPITIQDQALYGEVNVSDEEAWSNAAAVLAEADRHNGFVTLLWHNTSYAVPTLWGEMYERIIRTAQADGARIVRAIDAVDGRPAGMDGEHRSAAGSEQREIRKEQRMFKICMLTSEHVPFDQRIYYREAVSLAKAEYHNVVIIAPGDGMRSAKDSVDVLTVPRHGSRFSRFTITVGRVVRAAWKEHADIYHFHDPDLIPWMVGFALLGKKVVYDVHEYYGLSLQTAHWLPQWIRKPIAAIVDWMEKKANSTFAGTVTVNTHMEGLFRASGKKTVTISNYPLPWFIKQTQSNNGRSAGGRILYLGNLNMNRGYRMVLEAMKLVHAKHPEFVCNIIGKADYSDLDGSLPRLEDKEVEALGIRYSQAFVPYTDVPGYLQHAGVCWLPWRRTPNNELGTPVKLFEYMASGWPVVCSELGIVAPIVKEYCCGILVSPENPQAHADALIYLLTHPVEAAQMGARGRKAVVDRYNWIEEEKKLMNFYHELADEAT